MRTQLSQLQQRLQHLATDEQGAETLEYLGVAGVTLILVAIAIEYMIRGGYQTVINTAKPIIEMTIISFGW